MNLGKKKRVVKHPEIVPIKRKIPKPIEKPIEVERPIEVPNWPQPAPVEVERGHTIPS